MQQQLDFFLERLANAFAHAPHAIASRRMFGEHGLFIGGKMVAIVRADGRFYCKVSALLPSDDAFCYLRRGKAVRLRYVRVDEGWLDQPETLRRFMQARCTG